MATINGDNSDNSLTGTGSSDTISGLGGNDTIDGRNGNDLIYGGDGDDQIAGGSGDDTIYGDDGADLLDGGANNDQIFGGAGNDTITGGTGSDTLDGGAGIDTLSYAAAGGAVTVNLATNTASGSDASGDVISNFENIIGSASNDLLTGNNLANELDGGAGNNSLSGGAGNNSLYGGAGNDSLSGGDDNDLLSGGAGADTLSGGNGIDTADYSTSGAAVSVNLQTSAASGGDAAGDVLSSIENLTGSAFNDTLGGDNGANVIGGGAGADLIEGNNGADALSGGTGADTIAGGIGNDTLDGGDQNDLLLGGAGNDSILGGAGDDVIYGDADRAGTWTYRFYDRDFSSANGQAFTIETGALRLEGTTSDFNLRNLAAAARGTSAATDPEDFGVILTSTYTATTAGTYRFTTTSDDGSTLRIFDANGNPLNFANQTGGTLSYLNNDFHQAATTRFGDVTLAAGQTYTIELRLWENLGQEVLSATVMPPGGTSSSLIGNSALGSSPGNTGNDTILGGDGNDTIFGEAGNDSLSGDLGADRIDGGTGLDSLYGGDGNDTLIGGLGEDFIDGGDGDDLIYGDTIVADATSNHGDTIFGGAGNDTIYGGNGNDLIYGLAGNDSLYGDNGDDTLFGGDDDDRLFGGNGKDALFGGTGNDTLSGGNAGDSLSGDAGDDTLMGGAGADTMTGGDGTDVFIVNLSGDGFGDVIDGSESAGDADRLDLSGAGPLRVVYDSGNPENGVVNFLDASRNIIGSLTFRNIETVVPCFTPGTPIATARGDIAVERLVAGDLVQTRDSGLQPLRWVGTRTLGARDVAAEDRLRPVHIAPGALGSGRPGRGLVVSPQHRVLVVGARAELLFGEPEVLVAALHLVGLPGISRGGAGAVTYLHLMFDRHEIVQSHGLWSESFQPADRTLSGMDMAQRAEIEALFPALDGFRAFACARRALKAHEASVLFAA